MQEILVVLHMAVCTLCRGSPPGIPAFGIDAVDAEQLKRPLFQLMAECGHHTCIFPLEETALRSGKYQDASACMTKDEQFHISLQRRTIPTMILTIHTIKHSHSAPGGPIH